MYQTLLPSPLCYSEATAESLAFLLHDHRVASYIIDCIWMSDSCAHSVIGPLLTDHICKIRNSGVKKHRKTYKGENIDRRGEAEDRSAGADKGGVMESPSPGRDTDGYCNSFCHSLSLSSPVPSLSVPLAFVPTWALLSHSLFRSLLTHLLYQI